MASFSDNFNRADGELGANWTPQVTGRDQAIVSNVVRPTTGSRNIEQYVATTPGADQFAPNQIATATGVTADLTAGVFLRAAAIETESYYVFRALVNPSGVHSVINKRVAGASTDLASESSVTWAATDIIQ